MLVLPNAWDAASARLIESEGFPPSRPRAPALRRRSATDGGVVPPNEMIEAIARIVRSVKLPVTPTSNTPMPRRPMPWPMWCCA